MALVRCIHCKVFLIHNKEEFKRHEARYHAYQSSNYELHHHRPLNKEEKAIIVARGEEKFKNSLVS